MAKKKPKEKTALPMGSIVLQFKESNPFKIEMGRQVTILDSEARKVYCLHDLAAYTWLQFDGSQTVRDIFTSLQKELPFKKSELQKSFLQFVKSLKTQGLVQALPKKVKSPVHEKPQGVELSSIHLDLESLRRLSISVADPLA